MTDPVSSVGSALGLQNWIRNRAQQVKQDTEIGGPTRAMPDGTQDAMLQAIEEATLEGLHKHGYVNHSMSRTEMIRTFLGLNSGILDRDESTVLSTIRDSVRESLRTSGYIDHTTPNEEIVRILLGLGSHADDETCLEMNVPIAVAIAEICAVLIRQDGGIAAQAYPSVSLEVLR